MKIYATITTITTLLLAMPFSGVLAQQGEAEEIFDEEALGEIIELGEFVVVGSRHEERTVLESPLPVDLIGGGELSPQGYRDMDDLLANILPSFNINTQPISDAATLVRPANLRGLPSDSTLILINGKRRHRASVISFLGGGTADGAQGPDLAAIPAIALERVEVLRDGASGPIRFRRHSRGSQPCSQGQSLWGQLRNELGRNTMRGGWTVKFHCRQLGDAPHRERFCQHQL